MFARRRPLARAAVVGGTAYVAGKAGAKAGANQAAEQQQQYAEPPAAVAPPPASGGMSEDSMAKLQQLADLHSQGVLTDAEFEVQKQKILQGM
jgi:hypothetical protein